MTRLIVVWGLYLVPLILGNYHIHKRAILQIILDWALKSVNISYLRLFGPSGLGV